MAKIYPFRGLRYDPQQVGDIGAVVTQPYDKISLSMREEYLGRHEANIVRVIKNEDYEEAAGFLDTWRRCGILRQDPEPSLYPYRQTFEYQGERHRRTGFIGLVSLQEEELNVKGHENILEEPLQDRLSLIRQTESNEGLIFTLFSDPALAADQAIESFITSHPPLHEVTDEYGVRHSLWKSTQQDTNQSIVSALSSLPLYIADGHHRFQTSVLFHRECLQKGWKPGSTESFDKRMMAFFNMESPGLKILPTHRAIRNLSHFDLGRLLEGLNRNFQVVKCSSTESLQWKEEPNRIGMVIGNPLQSYLLTPKRGALSDPEFMPELRGPARQLDVNILHDGILSPLLGIGKRELSQQRCVDYFREAEEMIAATAQGKYQAAFLLNPTTLEQVREISERGEKMPQKSTDFYPKLLTGLVLMKMEIEKG